MSIIGTRPPLISETNFYELHHRARLAIKPEFNKKMQECDVVLTHVKAELVDVWDSYNEIAENSAIVYAAMNLMLKWTDLLHKFFPESIRCTVHPKKNQFALAMNYAWNGVAWSEKWPQSLKNISTVPFYSLQEEKVKLVKFQSDIELDIYSQLYLRRFFSRDKRANYISQKISSYLGCCCATWINMGYVGYSRSDTDGNMFFSDSDNFIIRFIQKVRGISTKNSKIKYSLKRKILNKKNE